MTARKPVFYGWYIVFLMGVAMMLIYGIRSSFSVFFSPVLDEFGWYRGSTAMMLSLNIFVYGLASPVAGLLVDRWKPRHVVVIGLLILGIGTAVNYFSSQLWHFYLLFGVLAPIGSAFAGNPIFNPALVNWFGKKRGLAIGLGQIGGGLSFAYVMFVDAVISAWDWRPAFLAMAGLILVVLLPLSLVFYHYRPEDKGRTVYDADEPAVAEGAKIAPKTDWDLRVALKTPQLWLLVFTQFCFWGMGLYLVLGHQVRFAEDAGYTSAMAASIVAFFGIASIFGQLCSPISDKIGREMTVTVATVLSIAALIALVSVRDTSQPWLLYFFAVASGFALGLYSPNVIVGTADIFRGRNLGAISALLLTGVGFGGAIGPWLGGYIYDVRGSYDIAFAIAMGAMVAGCVSFWLAAPRNAARLRAKKMTQV